MSAASGGPAPAGWRRVGARPPPLEVGGTHVWRVALASDNDALALRPVLSPDERDRADRFHFPAHRTRWTVAHGWLRHVLSWYGGIAPAAIAFETSALGKPRAPLARVEFNLSHSGDVALIAVTRGGPVGVDVEQWDPRIDHLELAGHFFSAHERAALAALDGAEALVAGFFAAWTRKEAYIKATGDGVGRGLDTFDVTLAPGVPARLLADRRDGDAVRRWTMAVLDVGGAYSGALVAPVPLREVALFDVPAVGEV